MWMPPIEEFLNTDGEWHYFIVGIALGFMGGVIFLGVFLKSFGFKLLLKK